MPDSMNMMIAADHPALAGHFPGRPIVPGVLILDCVLSAAAEKQPGRELAGIPRVKFLRPLLPTQGFTIELTAQGEHALRFRCVAGSDELASGVLQFTRPQPS